MNVLTTTWRQLVRRRLWPVALLLVAALVAVPVLLKREADPVIPDVPVNNAVHSDAGSGDDAGDAFAEPVVAKASSEERSKRRRVLGARKDPFAPDAVKHPKKPKKAKPAKAADEGDTPPAVEPSGGSSAPSAPSSPTPVEPAPKPKVYEKGSLIVRFGDATGDLERMVLKKLGALPKDDESDQLLIYTGLKDHGKKAVFLVDESLEPTGDGTCRPHPSSCETIELAKGETEFFDLLDPETGEVVDQFELDIVDIK